MVLLDVVYLCMNRRRSYTSIIPRPTEGTMMEIELHTKYYNLVFISILSPRMLVRMSCLAMNAREFVILVDVRKSQ